MGKKRRIGVLGGTFNPPHLGHLILAQEAVRRLKLEKVVFIPTLIPPHKKVRDNKAGPRHRMTVLSCRGNPRFEVSDIEIKRGTVSYSIDTLTRLKKKYGKNSKLFFLTGSDALCELGSWKNISRIFDLAEFVVAVRPGFSVKKPKMKVRFLKMPLIGISSSMIRERVRLSLPIKHLVADPVGKFIAKHGLYR